MEMTKKAEFRVSLHAAAGVAQFAVYMGLFAVYYHLRPTEVINPDWYLCLNATLGGLFCSAVPWLSFEKLGKFAYTGVINPVLIYAIGFAVYGFYTWSIPARDDILITLTGCYLMLAPIGTMFVLFVKWQVA